MPIFKYSCVCDYVPMCYSYLLTLRGSLPRHDKAFTEANDKGDNEGMLKAFIACASGMHQVLLPSPDSEGPEITTPLNPADLGCTCKGFRKIGLCSHVIAITAEFIVGEYDRSYLESLLERVSEKTRGAHRPKKVAPGNQVQPNDNDDESEEEYDWEDQDLDMD